MRPLCTTYHLVQDTREVVVFDYGLAWYLCPRKVFESLDFKSRKLLKTIRKYEVSPAVLDSLGM
jgi:hypothetical protein